MISQKPVRIHREKFGLRLIPIALIIIVNTSLWTGILSTDGIIIQRDFSFPLFKENFERDYYPLWNDLSSRPNFERLPRLVLMSPVLLLVSSGVDISTVLKVMIPAVFAYVSLSMCLFLSAMFRHLNLTRKGSKWNVLLPIIGGLIFAYNPISMQFAWEFSLLVSIGTLPLLLYSILTRIEARYFPILMSVLLLASLGHPFIFLMNVMVSIAFTLLFARQLGIKLIAKRAIVTTAVFLVFFAWFLVPYVNSSIGYAQLRENNISRDIFDSTSDNGPFNIVLTERDKFAYIDTSPSDPVNSTFHLFSLSLLVGTGFAGLFVLSRRSRMITLFVAGGFIITTFLSLGNKSPFGEGYWQLVQSDLGWIIRSPLKFQLYQAFFIGTLFTLSAALIVQKIESKRLKFAPMAILLTLIIIGGSAFGIYNANAKSLNPISIPAQFYVINERLESEGGGKVLYYPRYDELPTIWSQGHNIVPFDMKSSKLPTYDTYANFAHTEEMLYDIPYNTAKLATPGFYNFLSSVGIEYIAFHNDKDSTLDSSNLNRIIKSGKATIDYSSHGWYLFHLKGEAAKPIRAVDKIEIVGSQSDILRKSTPGVATILKGDATGQLASLPTSTPELNYVKIAPTHWKIHVKANAPFVMAFTETYDSGWHVVSRNYNSDSFKLYGMINGFYINKLGEYDLDLKYRPQEMLGAGIVASISFGVVVAAILFVKRPKDWQMKGLLKNGESATVAEQPQSFKLKVWHLPLIAGLATLLVIPIFIAAGSPALANNSALIALFLLTISVVIEVILAKRQSSSSKIVRYGSV